MFDYIPEYTGEGERVKNPKTGETTTTGIVVSGIVVDTEVLYKLAQFGANNIELAEFFGLNESQIRYYFNEYLTKARSMLKIKLRRAQLKVAIENENPTMHLWLGKNILGQSESPYSNDDEKILPWTTDIEETEEDTDEL